MKLWEDGLGMIRALTGKGDRQTDIQEDSVKDETELGGRHKPRIARD